MKPTHMDCGIVPTLDIGLYICHTLLTREFTLLETAPGPCALRTAWLVSCDGSRRNTIYCVNRNKGVAFCGLSVAMTSNGHWPFCLQPNERYGLHRHYGLLAGVVCSLLKYIGVRGRLHHNYIVERYGLLMHAHPITRRDGSSFRVHTSSGHEPP